MTEEDSCFLCEKCFKVGDETVEFFGGYAHYSCFDKQMKENEERKKSQSI